jgi:homeobox-leucine zipper protein
MYSGVDENTVGTCSELIFAPIDASFSDDSPLLPSGFRIIPMDSPLVRIPHSKRLLFNLNNQWTLPDLFTPAYTCQDSSSPNCTLDLASTLEVGTPRSRMTGNGPANASCASSKAVMTIAFQFAFESHLQDSVATMARQYVRNIIQSVQRIALALSSSRPVPQCGINHTLAAPEAATLSRWICQSYRLVGFFFL